MVSYLRREENFLTLSTIEEALQINKRTLENVRMFIQQRGELKSKKTKGRANRSVSNNDSIGILNRR